MILIGQYNSPFVRRVAVALHLYGHRYEHQPWSTFTDADDIATYNPLRRVPALVLDDGEVLIESAAILDHLDETVGPEKALIAPKGAARRAALKICALATGLCDKMTALVYERAMHEQTSDAWASRCQTQIVAVLDALEARKALHATPFWFSDRIGHADVAVTCAVRFLQEAHPQIDRDGQWPGLAALAARCEALDAFKAVVQSFEPPAP